MANLTPEQVNSLFEKPKNKAQIERSIRQHERLRFHVHPALEEQEISPAYNRFLLWVKGLLPGDKYDKFKQLLTLPVPTVDLTAEIYSELRRALEGENGFVKFDFRGEGLEADFAEYRQALGEEQTWPNEGFETFKTAINNLIIIDLPPVQVTPRPAPYFYFLEPEALYDIELNYKGLVEYVIFTEGDLTRYVYDDSFYRTYTRASVDSTEWRLTAEVPHSTYDAQGNPLTGLGSCPARMFWDVPQGRPEVMQRKGVLTHVLSRLDKFLFWEVAVEYYETYGTFPIYWEYAADCDYTDEQGNSCDGGFVAGTSVYAGALGPAALDKRPCPKCERNRYIGPGSIRRVEAPADKQDADLREPAGIISVDVPALQNAQARVQQRREAIYRTCVGAGGEPENEAAKNEKQVRSGFESRKNALMTVKQSFERARTWVLTSLALLRYGREAFLGGTVLLGDEFYLVNEAELSDTYREDKAAGMPVYYLSNSLLNIVQTKYKNNPDMVQRLNILAHLEPYPEKTVEELATLAQQVPGLVLPEALALKLNFDGYVKRFETEELDILRFGINTDFAFKIQTIKTKLYEYAKADRESAIAQLNSGGAEPATVPPNAGGGNGNFANG